MTLPPLDLDQLGQGLLHDVDRLVRRVGARVRDRGGALVTLSVRGPDTIPPRQLARLVALRLSLQGHDFVDVTVEEGGALEILALETA